MSMYIYTYIYFHTVVQEVLYLFFPDGQTEGRAHVREEDEWRAPLSVRGWEEGLAGGEGKGKKEEEEPLIHCQSSSCAFFCPWWRMHRHLHGCIDWFLKLPPHTHMLFLFFFFHPGHPLPETAAAELHPDVPSKPGPWAGDEGAESGAGEQGHGGLWGAQRQQRHPLWGDHRHWDLDTHTHKRTCSNMSTETHRNTHTTILNSSTWLHLDHWALTTYHCQNKNCPKVNSHSNQSSQGVRPWSFQWVPSQSKASTKTSFLLLKKQFFQKCFFRRPRSNQGIEQRRELKAKNVTTRPSGVALFPSST